jgi:transposase
MAVSGVAKVRSALRPPGESAHAAAGDPPHFLSRDRRPSGLSVDDFALRTRHTYGTLLLDLARRRPLAFLPDREAATVAHWLQTHPGVEVLVRDRAEAYAEAARTGAPTACQVADRLHLLQNLAAVLTEVFTAHASQLTCVNPQRVAVPTPVHDPTCPAAAPGPSSVPLAPQPSFTAAARLARQRRTRRWAQYHQVWTSHQQGWTMDAIAPQVGLSRRTVQGNLQSPTFLERQPRHGRDRSMLDPYKAILLAGIAGVGMAGISSGRSAAKAFRASMALWLCTSDACARRRD